MAMMWLPMIHNNNIVVNNSLEDIFMNYFKEQSYMNIYNNSITNNSYMNI